MNKFYTLLMVAFGVYHAHAQVFTGSQEIDKNKREGGYILTSLDQKTVDKIWLTELQKLGKPLESKGAYTVKDARLTGVSDEPVSVFSKVGKQKDRTLIFISVLLANGDIVTNGHEKWSALSDYLTSFQNTLTLHEGVRNAENIFNQASDNHKKIVKNGDRLKDKIEDNKKEKEKLLKKIEENRIELEKLLSDVEVNKRDQSTALDDIVVKKRLVEEAKAKIK